jgi:hypothetical protein
MKNNEINYSEQFDKFCELHNEDIKNDSDDNFISLIKNLDVYSVKMKWQHTFCMIFLFLVLPIGFIYPILGFLAGAISIIFYHQYLYNNEKFNINLFIISQALEVAKKQGIGN